MRLAKPITYAVAVAILVAWFTYKPLATFLKKRRAVMQLPGPPIDNFFMGNTSLLSIERPKHARLLTDLMYNYGGEAGVIRLLVGPLPQVSVSSPEGIKIVLGSSKHSKKGSLYSFLYSWLGTGLLTSEGTKWKTRRRMITPTFHFDILKRFLEVMNEQTNTLIKKIDEKSKSGPIEIFQLITLCALDIISETAMGRKVNAQLSDGKNEYVECVYKGSKAIMDRLEKPWLFPEWAYRLSAEGRENRKVIAYLHEYSRKVIRERKEKLKEEKASQFEGEKSRPAFLDILLAAQYEDGRPLDDEDIREEVDTFMFEGHDTTSASIAWTLQLLGLHPEIQTAVQQEVDAVLGDSDTVTYEMLGEFKYLEMVLKESLRVFPSVPFIERVLTEDAMLGGVNVPAGTNIDIQIYALHHSPRYWDEPEVFKPERWADESEERDPYKYIPFSAGPRNCIGQKFAQNEEKVMIAKIMKHFTVKSLKQEVPSYPELILRPGEVTLEIQRR